MIIPFSYHSKRLDTKFLFSWKVRHISHFFDYTSGTGNSNHDPFTLDLWPTCVDWFRSYLVNRSLKMMIGATESDTFSNPSSVPQGSNLRPLLFTVFINDVLYLLASGCRHFYADDTENLKIIKTSTDCWDLQNMQFTFADWCYKNLMTLSFEKCNIISYHWK